MTQRRFCVMTFGRTGSTWLMQTLAAFPDVAVPAKNVDSPDNELLWPGMPLKYAQLTRRQPKNVGELIELFFSHNAASNFAGFKSMPNRHPDFAEFVQRRDIRFITLERRDLVATAGSFLMARMKGTWRRSGGRPEDLIDFTPEFRGFTAKNLQFILQTKLQLASMKSAIRLYYEELCEPGFASAELDEFFERPVRLAAQKPATLAQDYIQNWDEFRDYVQREWEKQVAALPPQARSLL